MIDQTTPDLFLAALSLRDFGRLADCLAPSAQARMLLPRGAVTRSGRDEIAGAFEGWFGRAGEFVVLDAGCQAIGRRNLLSWRFTMSRNSQGPEVIEQLAFVDLGPDGITQIDLLCSGFLPSEEPVVPHP